MYAAPTHISASFTRPSDTTAYAAEDAVSDSTSAPAVLTFAAVAGARAIGGIIAKATLLTNKASITPRFRLHLYKSAPTAINDNAQCTAPLYADSDKYLGFLDFPALTSEGTGATSSHATIVAGTGNLPFVFAGQSSTSLFGILEALDAFTPDSAQQFTITLSALND